MGWPGCQPQGPGLRRKEAAARCSGGAGAAIFGTIESLDLRQATGELVHVPNRKVFESSVINFSVTTRRRVDVPCSVSFDADLEQVRATVLRCMTDLPHLLPDRPVEVMFTDFADSAGR